VAVVMIGLASSSAYAGLQATIGSQGTGNGQFNQPWGLGVNSTGWIFVAEYYNHRISLFDNSTSHTFSSHIVDPGVRENNCYRDSMDIQAGDPCGDDGEFKEPMDIEFDSSDNFWVLEVGNHRLQKFDQHGTFISKFGTPCTMNSAGTAPTGGVNGDLCNTSASGAVVAGDGQFYSPKDFAIDPSGNIWVADTNNNRIQKFDSSGNFLLKFGSEGCQTIQNDGSITGDTHNGKFCNPVSLDFDSSGKVYVADHNNRRIQQFDSSGTYLTSFGSYGTTDGKFKNPHFMTIDSSDHIYVGDRERGNVQVFDDSFNFRYAITGLSDPKDIVIDTLKRLLVAYNHAVNVYTSSNSTAAASTATLDFSSVYEYEILNFTGTQLSQITIPSTNGGASLEFSNVLNQTAADNTNKNIYLPNRIVVNATTADADIDVIIQAGTSINGTNWNGGLELANNIDKSTISVEGQTINLATSFGSDDVDLTFSKPMRMKMDGMANQAFGYVDAAGVIDSTQTTCLEDSFSNVTSMLGGSGQCSMTVGNDLIAYVYHFTKFFTSSDTPASSTSGGKNNCDSNGFGQNNSLRVYQVNYNINTFEVQVHAYSTCGSIQTKMTTPMQQSILELSTDQPLLDDRIAIYSGFLDESEEKFNISIQNKRNSFTETFYIYDKSISKSYIGDTGYTSEQQGTQLPTVTSKQTTVVSEPSVTQIVQTIKDPITIDSKKQIPDEKSVTLQVQSIGYTPEPVAEKETMPQCGVGTKLVDGICKIIKTDEPQFCFLFWCW
jgi:sugar lactone lactonase YvrE